MAEPTAHTEAPKGHGAFPPFQSQHFPSQLLWLTLTFALLYVLMSRIALPRIGGSSPRGISVSPTIWRPRRDFKERSEAANAAYLKSLADARARAQAIANETRARQVAEAKGSNKRLEAQLNEKLAAAEQSITATRSGAMENVGKIAAETAAAIVERLIGVGPKRAGRGCCVGDVSKR